MKQKRSLLNSTGHGTGRYMQPSLGVVLQRDKAQKMMKKLARRLKRSNG